MNVAGTRTLVEPPLLFDFLWVEPPPTPAPPLEGLVVVDACVVDDACVVVAGEVVEERVVVEDGADCVDVVAGVLDVAGELVAALWDVVECEEPPHPPIDRNTGSSRKRIARLLTFSG